jgi:hypothetical protein
MQPGTTLLITRLLLKMTKEGKVARGTGERERESTKQNKKMMKVGGNRNAVTEFLVECCFIYRY